jgi:hypothetical protein
VAQNLLDLDRKIARSSGLPAFLQRFIQFKEASSGDRPTLIHYKSKIIYKKTLNVPPQENQLYVKRCLLLDWSTVGRVGGASATWATLFYLNAILQCLYYTTPLNLYLLKEHNNVAWQVYKEALLRTFNCLQDDAIISICMPHRHSVENKSDCSALLNLDAKKTPTSFLRYCKGVFALLCGIAGEILTFWPSFGSFFGSHPFLCGPLRENKF